MDIARQQRSLAGPGEARDDAPLEIVQHLEACGARRLDGLFIGGMRSDQMIDRSPGRGLAALVQPEAGHHARVIGPPHARHEARLGRRRHDARRGSHDVGEAIADIDRPAGLRPPADRADAAGVGVDQRRADGRALDEPEILGGGFRQARAQRGSRYGDVLADPRIVAFRQVAEADALEIVPAPATVMGEIVPFAGQRADRARRRPCRLEGEEVGQIEKMTGLAVGRRQMPLQPEQLGHLHFRRDRAADIAKDIVLRLVDGARFGHGAMVHPDDDVAAFVAGRADGERIAARVEHHERAGRIEAQPLDGRRRKAGLRHGRAHGSRAGQPDVGRRLLDDVARLVPDRDGMPGRRQQRSAFVEHAGPGTRCADVDADEGLPHCDPVSTPG